MPYRSIVSTCLLLLPLTGLATPVLAQQSRWDPLGGAVDVPPPLFLPPLVNGEDVPSESAAYPPHDADRQRGLVRLLASDTVDHHATLARRLGGWLADDGRRSSVFLSNQDTPAAPGFRSHVAELLNNANNAVTAAYRASFGPRADRLLRSWRSTGDSRTLISLVRRYPLTTAGRIGHLYLARWYQDRGQARHAIACLDRLSRLDPGSVPLEFARSGLRESAEAEFHGESLQPQPSCEALSEDLLSASAHEASYGPDTITSDSTIDSDFAYRLESTVRRQLIYAPGSARSVFRAGFKFNSRSAGGQPERSAVQRPNLLVTREGHGPRKEQLVWSETASATDSEAVFLGPPVSYDGTLFVAIEIGCEIRLLALDRETGNRLWTTDVAWTEPSSEPDPIRHAAIIVPVVAGDTVVCPTAGGCLSAVDLITGELRWCYCYQRTRMTTLPSEADDGSGTNGDSALQADWRARRMLWGRRLLLAPTDSTELHCLEMDTGRLCWIQPLRASTAAAIEGRRRGDLSYAARASGRAANHTTGVQPP